MENIVCLFLLKKLNGKVTFITQCAENMFTHEKPTTLWDNITIIAVYKKF